MKPENYNTVRRLMDNLHTAQKADEAIYQLLHGKTLHDSDGGFTPPNHKGIYTLFLTEHSDGSGFKIDLTGLQLGTTLLEIIALQVKGRLAAINEEISKQ